MDTTGGFLNEAEEYANTPMQLGGMSVIPDTLFDALLGMTLARPVRQSVARELPVGRRSRKIKVTKKPNTKRAALAR
jgi:hypothetical protein